MMKYFFFLTILATLLVSACHNKIAPENLKNSKWVLAEIPDISLPQDTKATLNFSDSLRISGRSFCNNYGGQAEFANNSLTLGNIFGTKMFCQETDAAERAYLHALNQVNQAKINAGKLYLMHGEQTLLVFNKVN